MQSGLSRFGRTAPVGPFELCCVVCTGRTARQRASAVASGRGGGWETSQKALPPTTPTCDIQRWIESQRSAALPTVPVLPDLSALWQAIRTRSIHAAVDFDQWVPSGALKHLFLLRASSCCRPVLKRAQRIETEYTTVTPVVTVVTKTVPSRSVLFRRRLGTPPGLWQRECDLLRPILGSAT